MAYTKNLWAKGDVISSAKLNNIENGISGIDTTVTEINGKVTEVQSTLSTLQTAVAAIGNSISEINDNITNIFTSLNEKSESIKANTEALNTLKTSVQSTDANVAVVGSTLVGIPSAISSLQEQVRALKRTNEVAQDISTTYTNAEADVVGAVALPAGKTSATVKSIEITGGTADSSAFTVNASGDVAISDVTSTGKLEKATSNASWSINGSGTVDISNCTFGQEGYNCVEVGLGSVVKSVTISDCTFDTELSNNAILVFNTLDNAVITVKNCKFKSLSNVFRLSNGTNAKGVVVNIVNCVVEKWDTNNTWAGMVICEDYTSKTADEAVTNNLFGDGKVTFNIIECTGPYGKITSVDDLHSVLGTADTKTQLLYVYRDKGGLVKYTGNESSYPTVNIVG